MKTFFIRHSASWDVEAGFRQRLWKQHKIAICFEDIRSYDPKDYHSPSARRAVGAFAELAQDGGYVCAMISPYEGCLVARVPKNTPISFENIKCQGVSSRNRVVKVISLRNAREVPADKANRLLIGQPQQGTITTWKIIRDRVQRYVEDGEIKITCLDDLLPYEQEVMCSEFMRTAIAADKELPRLVHLSAPVGRTRKALDITGVTPKGAPIFAQVTHLEIGTSETNEKADVLREVGMGGQAYLVMFCRAPNPHKQDGVYFYPIQKVFDEMKKFPAWRVAIGIYEASK